MQKKYLSKKIRNKPLSSPFYYPAFLNLNGKECLVIGGGKVAERKALTLLRCGANVKVISPTITKILQRQRDANKIIYIKRNYKKGDSKKAFLVIAATSDIKINKEISKDAPYLVNVVDMPLWANFIVPSCINKNLLTIAVSTSCSSPSLSKSIKNELELLYGKDFGQYTKLLSSIRKDVIRKIADKKTRERFFKFIASKTILSMIREKGFPSVKTYILKRLKVILND